MYQSKTKSPGRMHLLASFCELAWEDGVCGEGGVGENTKRVAVARK